MSLFSSIIGRHIEGFKNLSKDNEVIDIRSKEGLKVYFPTVAVNNTPINVLVKPGDKVKVGQKIAERTDLYVPIYSSVSGTILEEETIFSTNVSKPIKHVVIEDDGKNTLAEPLKTVTLEDSKEDIFAAIKEAGLVGLGGAGFPTYVKYNNPENIHTIVINGVECEPYLTTDYVALKKDIDEAIHGCKYLLKVSGAEKVVIAIKKHKNSLKKAILEEIAGLDNFKLVEVPDKYPMGWERILVRVLFHKEYKALPSEVGVIVSNAQTVIELNRVLETGHPMVSRLVTVSGNAIAKPSNVLIKIGTQAKDLIEACGGFTEEDINLIPGGPMCTKAVPSDEFPLNMWLDGITVLKHREFVEQPCLRCGTCSAHCSIGLQPIEIRNALKAKDYDRLLKLDVLSCVECGMCSYSCPSKIQLTDAVRNAKKVVKFKMTQMKKK